MAKSIRMPSRHSCLDCPLLAKLDIGWGCAAMDNKRLTDGNADSSYALEPPSWCPLPVTIWSD